MFKKDLIAFIKKCIPWFIILLIVFVFFMRSRKEHAFEFYESPNTERVYGDQRVFDYADQLTDEEEAKLEAYIQAAEKKVCLDLVIVTLNQSLKDYEPEYMANYSMLITPDKYVMVYADKFWEDNKFGYDCPQVLDGTTRTGDGIILVDNLYREDETGKIYTWMGTTGKAEEAYSSYMIDNALDVFYEEVDYNYYYACTDFIDCIVNDMGETKVGSGGHIFALIVVFIYMLIHFSTNANTKIGQKTTTATTYLKDSNDFNVIQKDVFLRKDTSKVYDPPSSSSSGGGGHHSSGGGGSHGGGGHSR